MMVVVIIVVEMGMTMGMLPFMRVGVRMTACICVVVSVTVRMVMGMRFVAMAVFLMAVRMAMNIKFHALNLGFFGAANMQMVIVQAQLGQFMLEMAGINAEIDQRTVEHVAADTAEHIEIE